MQSRTDPMSFAEFRRFPVLLGRASVSFDLADCLLQYVSLRFFRPLLVAILSSRVGVYGGVVLL